jgi:hypothetical protein
MEFQHGDISFLGWLGMKKRRAWVYEGLSTSTTLHARHLWGRGESSSRSAAGHAARATCFFRLGFTLALAFLRRIHAFNAVNLKQGYPVLEIRNPREVIGDE